MMASGLMVRPVPMMASADLRATGADDRVTVVGQATSADDGIAWAVRPVPMMASGLMVRPVPMMASR